jgi:RNA polymerase sigma-54 factor
MKQSLQLKIGQQLTMTPQLQQAIKLLQLSTLDLQTEIQEALDSNPLLEVEEDLSGGAEEQDKTNNIDEAFSTAENTAAATEEPATAGSDDDSWNDANAADSAVETQWDDVYSSAPAPSTAGPAEDFDFESRSTTEETLQDHLMWQLDMTTMSDTDRLIALAIIDAIEPNGMMSLTPEDIHSGFDPELDIELDEVEAVRHRIQQFDPAGVATVDLQECICVQLKQLPEDTPWLAEALAVVDKYMSLLGNRDYAQLMRRMKLKEDQLKPVIELIQSMNPRPGDIISDNKTEYVVPDVFVSKRNDKWIVELNPDIAPKLRINADYAGLIRRADNSRDNAFLKDNLQEARWFLNSLQSRNETLMKVATCIVEHQIEFFEHGEEAMKPMVLHDIAQDVEMHESTISRVTTQKYMRTPRGIFELKYFFSSHVSTSSGGECSSTAIRAIIKKLVAAENPKKPLSDSKIATLLDEQGIKVARRTIAKYRESLNIPPSNERKRLI